MRLARTLALALLFAGCGSPADQFVGNWTRIGTQATTCGPSTETDQLSGTVSITPGSETDTIVSSYEGCDVTMDVSGDQATLQGDSQTCVAQYNGTSAEVTVLGADATLDGDTMTVTTEGSFPFGSGTCTYTTQETLTRSS